MLSCSVPWTCLRWAHTMLCSPGLPARLPPQTCVMVPRLLSFGSAPSFRSWRNGKPTRFVMVFIGRVWRVSPFNWWHWWKQKHPFWFPWKMMEIGAPPIFFWRKLSEISRMALWKVTTPLYVYLISKPRKSPLEFLFEKPENDQWVSYGSLLYFL